MRPARGCGAENTSKVALLREKDGRPPFANKNFINFALESNGNGARQLTALTRRAVCRYELRGPEGHRRRNEIRQQLKAIGESAHGKGQIFFVILTVLCTLPKNKSSTFFKATPSLENSKPLLLCMHALCASPAARGEGQDRLNAICLNARCARQRRRRELYPTYETDNPLYVELN